MESLTSDKKNEIVVYQPNETVRLEVCVRNESVWLSQEQIAQLFGIKRPAVTKHLANIYRDGELDEASTCSILEHMGHAGVQTYATKYYNLDAILSVGYRVNSRNATLFRRWATSVLREYLLRGVAVNRQRDALAQEMDRRLASHERRIEAVEQRVDFVVKSALPAPETVFFDGQFLDAHEAIRKIIRNAKKRLVIIDNYIDERVLTLLSERRAGVACHVYGKNAAKKDIQLAYSRYRQQYPKDNLTLTQWGNAHDRFIICDDTVWICGASVKDAGHRMFALVKTAIDPNLILGQLPQ